MVTYPLWVYNLPAWKDCQRSPRSAASDLKGVPLVSTRPHIDLLSRQRESRAHASHRRFLKRN